MERFPLKKKRRSEKHKVSAEQSWNVQSPLVNPLRHRLRSINLQQRSQQISILPQQIQKPSVATLTSSAEHNVYIINTNTEASSSERVQEKGHVTQQSSSPRLEHDDNHSSESVAVLQKIINDPSNTIVRHQIPGSTAKMLVMLASGEQRLITFDIPNKDCTVHDLLEQVDIQFSDEIQVSLVDDPVLGINYIVDARGSDVTSFDSDGDCNSSQKIVSTAASNENLSQITNASDENSNTSQTSKEPILVKEMLALCPHCSSLHFRCERCNTKLKIEEVKSIPMTERKKTWMSINMFYQKNNKRNATKLKRIEQYGPTCKHPKGKDKGKDKGFLSRIVSISSLKTLLALPVTVLLLVLIIFLGLSFFLFIRRYCQTF